MYLRRLTIDVLTTGVASNVDYSTDVGSGTVHAIQFVSAAAGMPTSAVASFTGSNSGITLLGSVTLTTDSIWYPRGVADNSTGTDLLLGTTGGATATWPIEIPIVGERVKCTIVGCSSAAAEGTFYVYVKGA